MRSTEFGRHASLEEPCLAERGYTCAASRIHIVMGQAGLVLAHRFLDAGGRLRGQRGRALLHHAREVPGLEQHVGRLRLGHAVRVQHERVAGRDVDRLVAQAGVGGADQT